MANALFVSDSYIKENTIIDENVDVKLLQMAIYEAQQLHILPYIGTGLYDEISSQINSSTLTALNTTLLESYIQPALKYWVLVEGVDTLTYQFKNKGVVKKGSEQSNQIDLEEVRRLIDKYKNKAEVFTEKIIKYLIQNTSSYPLYENPGTSVDTVFPKKSGFQTGIYLGSNYKYTGDVDYGRDNYC